MFDGKWVIMWWTMLCTISELKEKIVKEKADNSMICKAF